MIDLFWPAYLRGNRCRPSEIHDNTQWLCHRPWLRLQQITGYNLQSCTSSRLTDPAFLRANGKLASRNVGFKMYAFQRRSTLHYLMTLRNINTHGIHYRILYNLLPSGMLTKLQFSVLRLYVRKTKLSWFFGCYRMARSFNSKAMVRGDVSCSGPILVLEWITSSACWCLSHAAEQ